MAGEDEEVADAGDVADEDDHSDAVDAAEAGAGLADVDVDVGVPDDVTEEEAAAITAAVGAYLAEERAAAKAAEGTAGGRPWAGRRWAFAGRLGQLTGRAARVPEGAPDDGWSVAARADRF